jgi:hypothetical protein
LGALAEQASSSIGMYIGISTAPQMLLLPNRLLCGILRCAYAASDFARRFRRAVVSFRAVFWHTIPIQNR